MALKGNRKHWIVAVPSFRAGGQTTPSGENRNGTAVDSVDFLKPHIPGMTNQCRVYTFI